MEAERDGAITDAASPIDDTQKLRKINHEQNHQPDMKAEDGEKERPPSPTDSQKTDSDEVEIDYSVKPEFYNPNLDEKDEVWVRKKKKGNFSDAVLSCPACFTTLTIECQRHERYVTQYRAIFVTNCKVETVEISQVTSINRKRGKRGRETGNSHTGPASEESSSKRVSCSVCSTEVGVMDEDEVYHFFNALPSEC